MNGGEAVKTVGRIDRKLYSCVAPDILTDEVVITDERIAHIKERHPNDYEDYSAYIPQMIADPDYIIEDTRPYTGMILKSFEENGRFFRLCLRFVTPQDDPGFKNSIITFMKIRKKEWNRLLNNKTVLYKKE